MCASSAGGSWRRCAPGRVKSGEGGGEPNLAGDPDAARRQAPPARSVEDIVLRGGGRRAGRRGGLGAARLKLLRGAVGSGQRRRSDSASGGARRRRDQDRDTADQSSCPRG